MQALFYKRRRLPTNTGELECMAWNVMQKVFHTYLSNCKERQSFVIALTADTAYIRNWLYIWAKFEQNPLKVAGYETASFVKHNFSQVILKNF